MFLCVCLYVCAIFIKLRVHSGLGASFFVFFFSFRFFCLFVLTWHVSNTWQAKKEVRDKVTLNTRNSWFSWKDETHTSEKLIFYSHMLNSKYYVKEGGDCIVWSHLGPLCRERWPIPMPWGVLSLAEGRGRGAVSVKHEQCWGVGDEPGETRKC